MKTSTAPKLAKSNHQHFSKHFRCLASVCPHCPLVQNTAEQGDFRISTQVLIVMLFEEWKRFSVRVLGRRRWLPIRARASCLFALGRQPHCRLTSQSFWFHIALTHTSLFISPMLWCGLFFAFPPVHLFPWSNRLACCRRERPLTRQSVAGFVHRNSQSSREDHKVPQICLVAILANRSLLLLQY
jgi:hypothetical protein